METQEINVSSNQRDVNFVCLGMKSPVELKGLFVKGRKISDYVKDVIDVYFTDLKETTRCCSAESCYFGHYLYTTFLLKNDGVDRDFLEALYDYFNDGVYENHYYLKADVHKCGQIVNVHAETNLPDSEYKEFYDRYYEHCQGNHYI